MPDFKTELELAVQMDDQNDELYTPGKKSKTSEQKSSKWCSITQSIIKKFPVRRAVLENPILTRKVSLDVATPAHETPHVLAQEISIPLKPDPGEEKNDNTTSMVFQAFLNRRRCSSEPPHFTPTINPSKVLTDANVQTDVNEKIVEPVHIQPEKTSWVISLKRLLFVLLLVFVYSIIFIGSIGGLCMVHQIVGAFFGNGTEPTTTTITTVTTIMKN